MDVFWYNICYYQEQRREKNKQKIYTCTVCIWLPSADWCDCAACLYGSYFIEQMLITNCDKHQTEASLVKLLQEDVV